MTRQPAAPYTPRKGVAVLDTGFVDSIPVDIDWSEKFQSYYNLGQVYIEVTAACRCDTCGQIVVTNGQNQQHREADSDSECEGYLDDAMPMMNYGYSISVSAVGGVIEAARLLVDLPVCLVDLDDTLYLALTGGGMDLSWELCEAYMRLGYLPPVAFADLPRNSGRLTSAHRWVLAGMRRSLRAQMARLKGRMDHLSAVQAYYQRQPAL